MAWPAGATMASTAAASQPAATSCAFSTCALRALATKNTCRAPSASAARRPCRSRRPCVATTTKLPGPTAGATSAASSLATTRTASGKRAASAPCATTVTGRPTRGARPASAAASGESPTMVSRARGSIGSTKSSSVPPEWQAMPNSSTSSSSRMLPASAGAMRITRATPSASAFFTVRSTAGCAQPPPIQPCTMPSAVTTALSPGFAEAGACTRSTLTSA